MAACVVFEIVKTAVPVFIEKAAGGVCHGIEIREEGALNAVFMELRQDAADRIKLAEVTVDESTGAGIRIAR